MWCPELSVGDVRTFQSGLHSHPFNSQRLADLATPSLPEQVSVESVRMWHWKPGVAPAILRMDQIQNLRLSAEFPGAEAAIFDSPISTETSTLSEASNSHGKR